MSREELLSALETGWVGFLPSLARWPAEEQTRYAQQQGYSRLQNLLAHVCAWWQETLQVVPDIWNHQAPDRDYDIFYSKPVSRPVPKTAKGTLAGV